MTRGRRGSLLLRRRALPSPPPNRFIPAHPLGSTPITGASQLLRAGPPARQRIGTHSLAVSAAWEAPSRHPDQGSRYRDAPSHVPRGSGRPGSRHLHAGHHLASQRTSARLIPRSIEHLGSDAVCLDFDTSTMIVFLA